MKLFDFLLGLIIISLIVVTFNFGQIDKAIKCNKELGRYCNHIQIERLESEYGTAITN